MDRCCSGQARNYYERVEVGFVKAELQILSKEKETWSLLVHRCNSDRFAVHKICEYKDFQIAFLERHSYILL